MCVCACVCVHRAGQTPIRTLNSLVARTAKPGSSLVNPSDQIFSLVRSEIKIKSTTLLSFHTLNASSHSAG